MEMSEIKEFEERDGEFIRILRYYPEGSIRFQTAKQKIDILNTVLFGRTLFINGVLQSSVADEHLYHMNLVSGVYEGLSTKSRICILGGGEGATARAVLTRLGERANAHVTMIDWDTELVEHFRQNEPRWTTKFLGGNVFDDSRLTVEHSDIFKVLEEPRIYDCIYVDLVDPDMNDPMWHGLFAKLLDWMPEGGVITINAGGCYPWDMSGVDAIKILYSNLNIPDNCIAHSKVFVPSFGREWAFVRITVPVKGTQFGMSYFNLFDINAC